MSEPRTQAAEALLRRMPYWRNSAHSVTDEVVAAILAIEAEAVALNPQTVADAALVAVLDRIDFLAGRWIDEGDIEGAIFWRDGLEDIRRTARAALAASAKEGSDVAAYVDRLEALVHPEGRCAECGGGKPYWKHGPVNPPFHVFRPSTPAQEGFDGR